MRILLLFILVGTFFVSFVPAHFLNPAITSIDDTSYISHAMTLGLDLDFDYSNEITKKFNKQGTAPSHPFGFGLLATPFVFAGGLIDMVFDNDVLQNRYEYSSSWAFFGILFSVSFYFLLGFYFLLRTIAERHRSCRHKEFVIFMSAISVISSGILYYVLGRFTMSHGLEFGLISSYIYISHKFQTEEFFSLKDNKLFFYLLTSSLIVSLMIMLRPANIGLIMLPIIVSYSRVEDYHRKPQIRGKNINLSLFFWSVVMFLSGLIIFSFNFIVHEHIWPSSEFLYNTNMLQKKGLPEPLIEIVLLYFERLPQLVKIFFSSEVGVLFTMPVVFLGVLYGFFSLFLLNLSWVQKALYLISGIIVFGLPIAIVLLWQTTASDYGYRYMMCLIPVSVILFSDAIVHLYKTKFYNSGVIYLILISFIFSFLCFLFYKSDPVFFPSAKINVFGVYHLASLNGYTFRVVENLFEIWTWVSSVGKGLISLLLLPFIPESLAIEYLPSKIFDKYYLRFRVLPLDIFIQAFLLFILWSFGSLKIVGLLKVNK